MQLIGIDARADGVHELLEGITADRETTGVGGEVARDDVGRTRDQSAEISAATKVCGRIHLLPLTEIWIAARCVFGRRASGVAAVAVAYDVNVVAA